MTDHYQEPAPPSISRFMAAALTRHDTLQGEQAEELQKLVATLTMALIQGHICIELTAEQRRVALQSSLVAEEARAPLVLSGSRLYFGRYFIYETELSKALKDLAAAQLPAATAGDEKQDWEETMPADPHQLRAVALALNRKFSIISGGPGTGKTRLIVTIISRLLADHGPGLRIALAAPTGKAALRMQESIKMQLQEIRLQPSLVARFPVQAMTLHRLLGLGRRQDDSLGKVAEPLGYDVVVVDEASMVDLNMMWRLVRALKKGARLVLLGDRDQLASVESGSVLADCIDSLPDNVATLEKSYRFNKAVARLAEAVKSGAAEEAWKHATGADDSAVRVLSSGWFESCIDGFRTYLGMAEEAVEPSAYGAVFLEFNRFRVLCALRRGLCGAEELNRRIERALKGASPGADSTLWYPGKPVLITRNDYNLGLYNGDIGICLPDPGSNHGLRVWFEGSDGSLKKFLPAQISLGEPAWALTVHKAQGSEFDQVVVVLPEIDNRVLCRELLYTAITRAKTEISLVASEEIFTSAVRKQTLRCSGLVDRLGRS